MRWLNGSSQPTTSASICEEPYSSLSLHYYVRRRRCHLDHMNGIDWLPMFSPIAKRLSHLAFSRAYSALSTTAYAQPTLSWSLSWSTLQTWMHNLLAIECFHIKINGYVLHGGHVWIRGCLEALHTLVSFARIFSLFIVSTSPATLMMVWTSLLFCYNATVAYNQVGTPAVI